jgi:hypothetical protein
MLGTPQYGGSVYENQKRPYKAAETSYTPVVENNSRKSSIPNAHNQSTDYYKSKQSNIPLQQSNTAGGGFEYKTYEKLRLLSQTNPVLEKQDEPETRIKKIDEG